MLKDLSTPVKVRAALRRRKADGKMKWVLLFSASGFVLHKSYLRISPVKTRLMNRAMLPVSSFCQMSKETHSFLICL